MVLEYWGLDLTELNQAEPKDNDNLLTNWTLEWRHGTSVNDLKPSITNRIPVMVAPTALTPFAHPTNPIPYQLGALPLPDTHEHASGLLSGIFLRLDAPGLAEGGPDGLLPKIREDVWWSARVVVGYDDSRCLVMVHDPTFGPYWEVSYEDFDEMWKVGGRRYLVAHPPDHRDLVAKLPLEAKRTLRTPDHQAAVRYVFGYALSSIGRNEEAEAQLREELGMASIGRGYRFLRLLELAVVRAKRGDLDEAIQFAEQASQVLPEHGASWDLLEGLYARKYPTDPRRDPWGFIRGMLGIIYADGWARKSLKVGYMSGRAQDKKAQKTVKETLPRDLNIGF